MGSAIAPQRVRVEPGRQTHFVQFTAQICKSVKSSRQIFFCLELGGPCTRDPPGRCPLCPPRCYVTVGVASFSVWTKLPHVGPCWYSDGRLSSGRHTISVSTHPTRSTRLCIPPGSLNRVPASVRVREGSTECHLWGMADLSCVIPFCMWVPEAVRLVANCYTGCAKKSAATNSWP